MGKQRESDSAREMAPSKPTILLIPGAWNTAESYEKVVPLLEKRGYKCRALTLPSTVGNDPATHFDDAEHIQRALTDLVDQGEDVIIVMHSYGGIAGTESAKGFSKAEREKEGKKGGVVGLVFLSAFLLPVGMSLASFLGDGFPPAWVQKEVGPPALPPREADRRATGSQLCDCSWCTRCLLQRPLRRGRGCLLVQARPSLRAVIPVSPKPSGLPDHPDDLSVVRARQRHTTTGTASHDPVLQWHFHLYVQRRPLSDVFHARHRGGCDLEKRG